MTVIELLRQASARRTAIYTYARAHDHFAELEQSLIGEGWITESEGAHQYALAALRAYRAELDDPTVPAHDEACRG